MSAKTPLLPIIIDELLPFVRGSDLLALALTCRGLHHRIFQSKRWKALPIISDIFIYGLNVYWNYGSVIFDIEEDIDTRVGYLLEKYYETGLPMEVRIFEPDWDFGYFPGCQWIKTVTKIKEHEDLPNLDYLIKKGLLPERLEFMSLLNLSGALKNWKRLTRLKSLELVDMDEMEDFEDAEEIGNDMGVLNLLPKLRDVEIDAEYLDFRYLQTLKNIKVLNISCSGFRNLFVLKKLKQLKRLSISANLDDISFLESMDNLEILILNSYETIIKFPSRPPKKLKTLKLDNIKNQDLDWLSGWNSLEIILLRGPKIISVDGLGNCANLKEVKIDNAKVYQLKHLVNCKKLMALDLSGCIRKNWNAMTELQNLQSMTTTDSNIQSLSQLKIDDSKIEHVPKGLDYPQEFLKRLTQLILGCSEIVDISPLRHASQLKLLCLPQNKIQDIQPLSNLVQLDELDLLANEIQDISPLAGLLKLKYLNLNYNRIVNIEPLSNLVELEILGLAKNKIMDIKPLLKLKKINALTFDGNPAKSKKTKKSRELRKKLMRWKRQF